jgi:iron complex outermembrane receptor protein
MRRDYSIDPSRSGNSRSLAFALAFGASLATLSVMTASAQQSASARASFNIRPQPLAQALISFSSTTGVQLFFDANLVRGKQSPGAEGAMSSGQALARILSGSGLNYRFTNASTVTITGPVAGGAADVDGAIALDTIDVRGEVAGGPVNGYVAQQSATATKTGTPLLETPQTISVITREQMTAQQAQSVRDTVRYAPGVYFSDDADFRFEPVNARGFALDPYVDGLRLMPGTWSTPRVDPYFLERAEVLEGPSSTLYGQASPGGLLNMISKRPTATPLHEVQIQTGSFNRIQGAFDFSGPIDPEGKLLYRLTGIARDTGTQVDHLDQQRVAIAPALTWRPTADTSLTLLASYLHDPKAGFWNILPLRGTLYPNRYGSIPRSFFAGEPNFESFDFNQAAVGYELEHRFNDTLKFRQNLRFSHIDLNYREAQVIGVAADDRTLQRQAYMAKENLNTVTLDNQLQADFVTGPLQHTAILGLDYQYKKWDNFTRFGAAPALDLLNPVYGQLIPLPGIFQNADQVQRQLGVYVQDQIKFGDFVLSLGGRQDWVSSSNSNHVNGVATQQASHAFTWHTGLLYKFDNGLAPYVSYATSFQPTAGTAATGTPFDPTKGEQYEAGIKYQPVGWNALLTASVFNLRQKNVLTADLDPTHPIGSQVQTGEVRSRGIEFSAVATVAENLSVRASYTYLDAEVEKANDGTVGKRLAGAPRNFASLWGDYTFRSGPLNGFGLTAGARYVDSFFATNANTIKIPNVTLFDAGVHYDLGAASPILKGTKLSVSATNLFDRKYVSTCAAVGCRWGVGRTVYATLSYRW